MYTFDDEFGEVFFLYQTFYVRANDVCANTLDEIEHTFLGGNYYPK